jgi:ATP-dependent Clp protease ATP-binding subunit ClpC
MSDTTDTTGESGAAATTVYDRFTALAKRAIVGARDAADSLGHDFIGTEHLLLGLAQTAGVASEALRAHGIELGRLREETARQIAAEGVASTHGQAAKDALSILGIDVAEIRRRADETFGPNAFKYPRAAFSLSAKKAVQTSLQEARELGHERIDTEHLLLAVLTRDDGAVRVLGTLGVGTEALRRSVLDRTASA